MKFVTNASNIHRVVDITFQVFAKCTPQYGGLFPAVTERQNGQLLMDQPLPSCIPGQRNSDRSPRGCNLQHDIPLLGVLDGLDRAFGRPGYQKLRSDYLTAFATVCAPASPTGLLPWGEHSYWDLSKGKIGNSYDLQYWEQPLDAGIETHHQMSALPIDDWKDIQAANPDVLPRFADGLDWHWQDDERTLFNRHAPITQFIRGYQNKRHDKLVGNKKASTEKKVYGGDFPRAAGIFIHDYACALALCEKVNPAWKTQMQQFSDNWWDRRLDSDVLPRSGRASDGTPALRQTLGYTNNLLSAASILRAADPDLADMIFDRAATLTRGVLSFDQPDAERGHVYDIYSAEGDPLRHSEPWAGDRGNPVAATVAIEFLNAAHAIGDERGVDLAKRVGEVYKESFLPRDLIVRAGDIGAVIALLGELARLTGDDQWVQLALSHATDALELYFDSPLPRCATGRRHYESQQGSSILIHALARLVCIVQGVECEGGLARQVA